MEPIAEKEKPKVKFIAPCIFSGAESTKEECACILYQRVISVNGCGPDCQGYRPAKGNT